MTSERDRVDEAGSESFMSWRVATQHEDVEIEDTFRDGFRAGAEWMCAEAVKEEALGDYRINGKLTTLRDRLSRLGTAREGETK